MRPPAQRRRSIRLREHDYASAGAYFVTICAWRKELLFADERFAQAVVGCWDAIPGHFPAADVDELVVMPNHVHGIVWITRDEIAWRGVVGARHASPLQASRPTPGGPCPGSLGAIVGSFKSAVTKRINDLRDTPGTPVWQRNYYERVIRDERELSAVREYIAVNPLKWRLDRENPNRMPNPAHDTEWAWLEGTPTTTAGGGQ